MTHADRTDPDAAMEGRGVRRWWLPVAIVIAIIALVAGVLWVQQDPARPGAAEAGGSEGVSDAGQSAAVEHPEAANTPDLSEQESRDPDDLLAEGPIDAPVVMVVFTDYQCQFCAQWSHESLPELREYVDRGELRIEYRDVNVYGDDSERAARASLAAAMQDSHQEFHDRLFENGEIRSSEQLGEEALVELADELGLDTEQFATDLNSEQVVSTIDENAQQGIDIGAFSTPAFIIGGTPTVGAQPTEAFLQMVDEALVESEG